MGALAGGEAQTPGVSVLRLVALPDTDAVTADAGDTTSVATNGGGAADDENEDDTSSAASYPGAVAASLVMACASFVALL